jgi:uncharacterized protein
MVKQLVLLAGWLLLAMPAASAQTHPTVTEIAAYTGLHAVAAQGDVAKLRDLLGQKPDLEQRDAHGRTAVHIAAHGGHREMVRG